MKYRDQPPFQWRAPLLKELLKAQADYKDTVALKSCQSEFHHKYLWCGFIKADDLAVAFSSAFS